jgi:signal transduction histidine kinase
MAVLATPYYSRLNIISILWVWLFAALLLDSCRQPNKIIPDHPARVDSILDKTNDLLNSGEIKRAENYMDSAYGTIPEPGTQDLWRKYEHKVNFYLNYEKDTKKARTYADSMSFVLKGQTEIYKAEYAKAIFSHSEVLLAERRYTEAFNSFYIGKNFARKYLDSCSYQEFSYKLGLVKYNQGQYLQAIPFFKQAFTEGSSCRKTDGFDKIFSFRQSNLNTIALCFELAGKLDSAVYYYRQALYFIDLQGPRYPERKQFIEVAKGVIMGNLGGVLVTLNQDDLAEKNLLESIRINQRPLYDVRDAQTAKLKLAGLYLKIERFKESEKLLNELQAYLSLPQNNNTPMGENIRLKWHKLKWDYFHQTGQFLKAYQYSSRYHAFQDSINRVNAGLKDVDLDQVFKDAEQRYKLSLLNKDNQLKQGYLIGFILIAFLALILLGQVWFSLKNSRRLNSKMAGQNAELQLTLGSLEQSQRENTNLMKVVAHDLRNPIGGITSLSEMMLQEDGRSNEDITMLQLIHTSGKNSLELVNDLLISNTLIKDPEKEAVDLYLMLHYCVDLLLYRAHQKKQKLVLKALHVKVLASREKMWRVVSNLIANAIKFSPEFSEISVQMELLASSTVVIKVEDHGIGIPAAMKDKIFDMFTEAKREGTGGEKPFGLGLAISRQIVEAHGGTIRFHSVPDQGTTFYVELPTVQ